MTADPAEAVGLVDSAKAMEMLSCSRWALYRAVDAGLPVHKRGEGNGARFFFDPKTLENAATIKARYGHAWLTVLRVASDYASGAS